MDYRPRHLAHAVEQALRVHPVVVLSGARQTGKTTLARHLPSAHERQFLSFDDLDLVALAREHPDELLARGPRLLLDEVQRAPSVLLAIKRAVDQRRRPGQFLLTGSANLLLMNQVSDSLAGRAVYLRLWPMTCAERMGLGGTPPWGAVLAASSPARLVKALAGAPAHAKHLDREILRGGMPVAALMRSQGDRTLWFDGFTRTYVERDLREVSQVTALPDFQRLMNLAARRVGQLLNQTDIGRDAALPQATTHRYLNLLEATFQIVRVPAFASNLSKRLIKTPKLYWADTGLAAHLAGVRSAKDLAITGLYGALLENLVFIGIAAYAEGERPSPGVFYYRTAGGAEVDFVIEHGERLLPIEVKARKQVRPVDLAHLESLLDDYKTRAPFGVILFDTDHPVQLTHRIVGLPLAAMV